MMINFTKMHGCGNDYIYINNFTENLEIEKMSKFIASLSDRHKGIGADGVIFICPSDIADAKMVMFNADGTEGLMCGNGIRCVGKYVYEHNISHKNPLYIETASGIKKLTLKIESNKVKKVTVDMGVASIKSKDIPIMIDLEEVINVPITLNNKTTNITCVSMGNPHTIIYVDDVDSIDINNLGPKWENNSLFPNRTNTEFIEIIDSHTLKMRVWERGSGETLACGTGACAAVVASILNGYVKSDEIIKVILIGGELEIKCTKEFRVFLTGNATEVYSGQINVTIDS